MQCIGLMYTSATKSAYILYFNVKLVVILEIIFFCKIAALRTWISVIMTSIGIIILCFDSNLFLEKRLIMNRGDTFTLVSACFSALFIIFVGKIAHFQKSIASTNCIYLFFTTLFFGCTLIFSKIAVFEIIKKSDAVTTCGMLYLGFVTYLGQYLQTYGQQNIEPSKAALIFALDPLYNVVWSYIYLDEHISFYCGVGITIIFIATFIIN